MLRFGFVHSIKQEVSLNKLLRATQIVLVEPHSSGRQRWGRTPIRVIRDLGGFRHEGVSILCGKDSKALAGAIKSCADDRLIVCAVDGLKSDGACSKALVDAKASGKKCIVESLLPGGAFEVHVDGQSMSASVFEKGRAVAPVKPEPKPVEPKLEPKSPEPAKVVEDNKAD